MTAHMGSIDECERVINLNYRSAQGILSGVTAPCRVGHGASCEDPGESACAVLREPIFAPSR